MYRYKEVTGIQTNRILCLRQGGTLIFGIMSIQICVKQTVGVVASGSELTTQQLIVFKFSCIIIRFP